MAGFLFGVGFADKDRNFLKSFAWRIGSANGFLSTPAFKNRQITSLARLVISSAAEQVAAHLRGEIMLGLRSGTMPGGDRLAAELGIGCNTAEAALDQLENEGLLLNRGQRRGRIVIVPLGAEAVRPLRIAILLSEAADDRLHYILALRHELAGAGHTTIPVPKTMAALDMNPQRILRMARETEADAWVILGGSSEVLDGFAAGGAPAFALFGMRQGKRIAGASPNKRNAFAEATRQLAALGHRRIVLLTRLRRRSPQPGIPERAFLDELASLGLPVGDYNLPDWKETPEGFHTRLEALFRVTPPTALIIDESPLFVATQQFLAQRKLRVPEDVSLVCTDASPDFDWCRPPVSHIRWDSRPLIRRIVKWATHIGHGKEDLLQSDTHAEFVPGGTIGPAKR